jgi:deazaflavin-dependent oxidoreductase (nitroreductase family)
MSATKTPPRGLQLAGLRLPIWLYRLRLGWLLGQRFLLLTHRGRATGRPRHAVLEVLGHDEGAYYVASGWGTSSDWYRNIQATPTATITVGRRTMAVEASVLEQADAADRLLDYARRHPGAFRELTAIMGGDRLPPTPDACRRLAESVPVIAFRIAG